MAFNTGEYQQFFTPLAEGTLVSFENTDIITVAANGPIGFGKLIGRVTDSETVGELWIDKTKQILGISIKSLRASYGIADDREEGFIQFDAMSVARKGRILVKVTGAVKAGDKAYGVHTSGNIIPNSVSADDIFIGRFFTDAVDGGLSELEINII